MVDDNHDSNRETELGPRDAVQAANVGENLTKQSPSSTGSESTSASENANLSEDHQPLLGNPGASIANEKSNNSPSDDGSQGGPDTQAESSSQDVQPQPVPASPQSSQGVEAAPDPDDYHSYREARHKHDKKWWGDRHDPPELGHPDRQFLFSHNPHISDQEFQDVLKKFNDRIRDPDTGELNPLGAHLRPSTPPLGKAEKQIQGLKDNRVSISVELEKEILEHFARNNGLHPALMEWCQDKNVVPIDLVKELVKMMDRLKLEMSNQLRDANDKFDELRREYDDQRSVLENKVKEYDHLVDQYEKREEEKGDIERKLIDAEKILESKEKLLEDVLQQSPTSPRSPRESGSAGVAASGHQRRMSNQTIKEQVKEKVKLGKRIDELENEVARLNAEMESSKTRENPGKPNQLNTWRTPTEQVMATDDSMIRNDLSSELKLLKDRYEVAMSSLEEAAKDCEAAENGRKDAEDEASKYKGFHQAFYLRLKESSETWSQASESIHKFPDETIKRPPNASRVLRAAAEEFQQLETTYEKEWPPNETALKHGKLSRDIIVQAALDKSEKKLQETFDQNRRLSDGIDVQLAERERRCKRLRKSAKSIKELEEKTSGQGQTDNTSASEQDSASSSLSLSKKQLQAEIKSLEGERPNADENLVAKEEELEGARKANKSLSDSLQEKENDLATVQEELESLNTEVETVKAENTLMKPAQARVMGMEQELGRVRRELVKVNRTAENLKRENKNLLSQVSSSQTLSEALKVKFTTADALIYAVRKQNKDREPFDNDAQNDHGSRGDDGDGLGPTDRINYLNMACFFRTRNYIQLALREGAYRLANVIFNDAENWVRFCRDDFAKMDPSVNAQINASMRILNGVRKIMTADGEEGVDRGLRSVQAGRCELEKHAHTLAFSQLGQLADNVIDWAREPGVEDDGQGRKKLFNMKSKKNKRIKAKDLQKAIKKAAAMKSSELRRSGFHSPLSPEKWSKNLDAGFESQGADDV
ncbi:hypothetical protein F66182_4096 [Fusarium sp. NRRL 66182]|nr:hypothetical protein F66182_4096 [Fusarium sp. NRRL 66182]